MPGPFEPNRDYSVKDLIGELDGRMRKVQKFIDENFLDHMDIIEGTGAESLQNILQEGVHAESICEAFNTVIKPCIDVGDNPKWGEVVNYFSEAYDVVHSFNIRVIDYMAHHDMKLPF